jgi:hypothetical protein
MSDCESLRRTWNSKLTRPSGEVNRYVWYAWPFRCASADAQNVHDSQHILRKQQKHMHRESVALTAPGTPMASCPALSRTFSMLSTSNLRPSFWNEATSALAVPDVSAYVQRCLSCFVMAIFHMCSSRRPYLRALVRLFHRQSIPLERVGEVAAHELECRLCKGVLDLHSRACHHDEDYRT